MAKHLNLSLGFTADVSGAKKALQDLDKTLTQVIQSANTSSEGFGLTDELYKASTAAADLKTKLNQATSSTGTLDLSKFSKSLKQSGKQLSDYADDLSALGPTGTQAFMQLARSITTAEIPLKRSNKLLDEFATTLKNTARWQLSSSILHGLMGGIQSAYYYAQDLNESLNNIRIVTGASVDEMSKFAKEANVAAKALSATTTEYTNAALIYYQQGDAEEMVKQKADITVKLANVTRQSAETVSDQLTSIWNNFAEGSDDLEHFADVLVRLGADTASSSDEISQGLEKFAAIGSTIGLSYESAAAALATVTAQTRQSADVVGTAFKTIFARIQGLNLGETLDDGTSLNKYSEALLKVGIDIKEQNGDLKDMDTILAEMGDKWTTLSKDQQVALAQTVAGVRQYNQLVALMDNWNFYEKNLQSAKEADGSLQEQADIWGESWEAASNRVETSLQGVYDSVLNDEAFIDILNVIADLVELIETFSDSIGGMRGVLLLVSNLMMKTFSKDIVSSISDAFYNIEMGTKKGRDKLKALRQEAIDVQKELVLDGSVSGGVTADIAGKQASLQEALLQKTYDLRDAKKELTEEEKKHVQELLDANVALGDSLSKTIQLAEQSDFKAGSGAARLQKLAPGGENKKTRKNIREYQEVAKSLSARLTIYRDLEKAVNKTDKSEAKNLANLKKRFAGVAQEVEKAGNTIGEDFAKELQRIGKMNSFNDMKKAFDELYKKIEGSSTKAADLYGKIAAVAEKTKNPALFSSGLDQMVKDIYEAGAAFGRGALQGDSFNSSVEHIGESINKLNGGTTTLQDAVSDSMSAVTSLAFGISQAAEAGKQLFDPEVDGLQKLISTLMVLNGVIDIYRSTMKATATVQNALNDAQKIRVSLSKKVIAAQGAEKVSMEGNTAGVNANKLAWMTHPLFGIIIAAISLAVGAIAAYTDSIKENTQAALDNAKTGLEQAKATKENIQNNAALRASISANLRAYKEAQEAGEDTSSIKENLDEATESLAKAYDIEGAALAKLTGKYEDYNRVASRALQGQISELQKTKEEAQKNIGSAASAITGKAVEGRGYSQSGGYVLELDGWESSFGSQEEYKIAEILEKHGFNAALQTGGRVTANFVTDYSVEGVLKTYDALSQAIAEVENSGNIDAEDLKNSGFYADGKAWLEKMQESVEVYRGLVAEFEEADLSLTYLTEGASIQSYEDTIAWIEKIEQELLQSGKTAAEVDTAISSLVNVVGNAEVSAFYEWKNSLEDVKIVSTATDETLDTLWKNVVNGKSSYDKATLSAVNWGAVTEDNIYEVLDATEKLVESQKNVAASQAAMAGAGKVASEILKNGISADNLTALQGMLDWGNEEAGIVAFSDFLLLTAEQQQQYLAQLGIDSIQTSKDNLQATIDANKELLAGYEEWLEDQGPNAIWRAETDVSRLSDLKALVTQSQGTDFNATNAQGVSLADMLSAEGFTAEQITAMQNGDSSALDEKITQWQTILNVASEVNALTESIGDDEEQLRIVTVLDTHEFYNGLNSLLSQDLEIGATITADDYKILEDLGVENLEKYLFSMADGTYELVDAAEDFNEAIFNALANSVAQTQNNITATGYSAGDIFSENTAGDEKLKQAQLDFLAAQGVETADLVDNTEALNDALAQQKLAYDSARTSILKYCEDLSDLNYLKEQGVITEKEYEKYLTRVAKAEAQRHDLDPKEVEAVAKALLEQNKAYKDNENKAYEAAIQTLRYKKGLTELRSSFDGIKKGLKSEDFTEQAIALSQLKTALSDITGIEASEISTEFITSAKNIALIEKAAKGDIEALRQLQTELLKQSIIVDIDDQASIGEVSTLLDTIYGMLNNAKYDIGVGIDDDAFITACNRLIEIAGWTSEEAARYFGSMGFDANVVTESKEVTSFVKTPLGVKAVNADGDEEAGFRMSKVVTSVQVPAVKFISKNNYSGGNIDFTDTFDTTGDGGGSDPEPYDNLSDLDSIRKDKNENNLKDEEKALKKISKQLEKNNKEIDKAYGKDKIDAIQKKIKLLQDENKALEEQIKQIEENNENNKQFAKTLESRINPLLKEIGSEHELHIEYDEDGVVEAGAVLNNLLYELELKVIDAQGSVDETVLEHIETLKTLISMLQGLIGDLDSGYDSISEAQTQIEDNLDEIMSEKYHMLEYELEIKVDLDESKLEIIDTWLDIYADKIIKMGEAAAAVFSKLDLNESLINTYQEHFDKLQSMQGEISSEDYVAGLKEVRDGLLGQVSALAELDDQMMHYYSDTLDLAQEEIDDMVDHMEHLTSVFDHYLNLMELLGKSKDYEAMGNFLQGRADTIKDRLDVATSWYKELEQQKIDLEAKMANTTDEAALELYREEWDALIDTMDAAQAEALGLTEEWVEAEKAIIENNMAKIANTLEKTFTDGLGFDQLMAQYDRLNTIQEEYLTKTNQMYETNKLMTQASRALDKTDNEVSKQKLRNFIEETKGLQETTKLSKYQLSVQQAKYELLQAEMALEDAKNAKSTVRLQRDSSGNYGYVYTADQDAIADAEQKVADAENNIYNISLEGQQQYTEKYMQAMQSFFEELQALNEARLSGEIASEEEYLALRDALVQDYFGDGGILQTYSSIYREACETDNNAVADNWAGNFGTMTQKTEEWKNAVSDYIQDIDTEFQNWEEISVAANNATKNALDDTKTATEQLRQESSNLAKEIQSHLIPTLGQQMNAVAGVTSQYAIQRAGVLALISTTMAYIETVNAAIAAASKLNTMAGSGGGMFDTSIDYSARMYEAWQAGDMAAYEQAKRDRETKIGITGNDYGASTEDIADWIEAGNQLEPGEYFSELIKNGMATGGYTGAWGPEGRIALLHEKELVLNQDDTTNILKAIDLIRDFDYELDDFRSRMLTPITSPRMPDFGLQPIEKIVQIEASFPGVSDRYEIEEAFNNLINHTSQYIASTDWKNRFGR